MEFSMKKETAQRILGLCRQAHPYEVGGLLLNSPIDDFVLVPGTFTENSIWIQMDQIPIYANKAGTFHSHPSPDNRPSRADKDFFGRMGRIHIIVGHPYVLNTMAAYDTKGKKIGLNFV
jgi:proteasome lid subunit RPN8/RPN11